MEASRYFHDYYAILEIPPTADEALIKSSYRRLAKLRHPDKNPDKPNATADFQLVSHPPRKQHTLACVSTEHY